MTDQNGSAATGGDAPTSDRPWWQHWQIWAGAAGVVLIAVGVIMLAVQDDDRDEAAPATTSSTTTTSTTTSTTTTTTTPPPALTLASLSSEIGSIVPASLRTTAWECRPEPTLHPTGEPLLAPGPLTAGSMASCRPTPLPAPPGGEFPVLTVLVLDDDGTYVATRAGVAHVLLNPFVTESGGLLNPIGTEEGLEVAEVPPGLNCTGLLAPGSAFDRGVEADPAPLTPEQSYFGVVMYYFLQDRSPLLDIDNNGIPCETLIPAEIVDTVWAGGWISSRYEQGW